MKDYRLSEVVEICKKYDGNCYLCPFQRFGDVVLCSFGVAPCSWDTDIEPRDMIELPNKTAVEYNGKYLTGVVYRKLCFFVIKVFDTEPEADAFLADLKKS